MPVKCNVRIKPVSEDEFHLLDYKMMEIVFSIHKDLGRLYDEKIYQNELAYRCEKIGFESVETEVPIQVSYNNFTKNYYVDLLINKSVIYELKTVTALTGKHQKQTLNYLLLMGMQYGKLVNMRPESVQYRFVSTNLNPEKRYKFAVDIDGWKDLDEDSIWLRKLIISLLSEWGAFLDTNLFYDAIKHFRGGEENVVESVEIVNDSRVLGAQKAHLLNSKIAFKISAVTKSESYYEKHIHKFLKYTNLIAIQWINFNYNNIRFKTIHP
ncbi:GxxExxY protein [Thermodesulfobacteriota bacterium]